MAEVPVAFVVPSNSVYWGGKRDETWEIVRRRCTRPPFRLVAYRVIPNDPGEIRGAVLELAGRASVVVVTGGTGMSPRDVTVEALRRIARKELPGFGEEHRRRSSAEVGLRAVQSSATAFIVRESLVVACPGNPSAVSVVLDILEEMSEYLLDEIKGHGHGRRN
ncbi:MAG: MogA/MoaB family molybdenum cofactor biosynthesis protein [Acidilobaceae archaeon]